MSAAETVAISLLRRFSEKQLPKASDLVWLVSEQDAPQAVSGDRLKQWQHYLGTISNSGKIICGPSQIVATLSGDGLK